MKTGANKTDVNLIARMFKRGDSADHISHSLQIDLATIKSFAPKKEESKSKSKLAEKSAPKAVASD